MNDFKKKATKLIAKYGTTNNIIILAISLLVLIGIIIGGIYLFKDNDQKPVIVLPEETLPKKDDEKKEDENTNNSIVSVTPVAIKTYELSFYDDKGVLISKHTVKDFLNIDYPLGYDKTGYDTQWVLKETVNNARSYYLKYNKYNIVSYNIDGVVKNIKLYEGLPFINTEPVKQGYKFMFWCTDKELNNKFDINTTIKEDTTLYAKFEYINMQLVNLSYNSITIGKGDLDITYKQDINDKNTYNALVTGKQLSDKEGIVASNSLSGTHLIPIKIYVPEGLNVSWSNVEYSFNKKDYYKPVENITYSSTDDSFIYLIPTSYSSVAAPAPTLNIKWDSTHEMTYNVASFFTYEYKVTYNTLDGVSYDTFIANDTKKLLVPPLKDKYEFESWYKDSTYINKITSFNNEYNDLTLFSKYDYIYASVKDMLVDTYNLKKDELKVDTTYITPNTYDINVSGKLNQASNEAINYFGFKPDTHIIPLEIYAPSTAVIDWNKVMYKVGNSTYSPVTADMYNSLTNGFIYLVGAHYKDEGKGVSSLTIKWDGTTESTYNVLYPNLKFMNNVIYMDKGVELLKTTYESGNTNEKLLVAPIKNNYNFIGWYDNKDLKGTIVSNNDLISSSKELTYYASYESIYKISYDLNSTNAINTPKNESINTYKSSDLSKILEDPTNTKAVSFDAWYTDKKLTTKLLDKDLLNLDLNGKKAGDTLTLYASWLYKVVYNVDKTLYTNITGSIKDSETVLTNNPVDLSYTLTGEKNNKKYKIVGWSLTKDGEKLNNYIINEKDITNSELTLYPLWEEYI